MFSPDDIMDIVMDAITEDAQLRPLWLATSVGDRYSDEVGLSQVFDVEGVGRYMVTITEVEDV